MLKSDFHYLYHGIKNVKVGFTQNLEVKRKMGGLG